MGTEATFSLSRRHKKSSTAISGCARTSARDDDRLTVSSALDADALPERHVIFDLRRRGLGLRIVPRRIVVLHAVDFHVVIMRRPLPRAHRGMTAGLQKFSFHRGEWEVLIPFDLHRRFAVRNYFAAPSCLGHDLSPVSVRKSRRFLRFRSPVS